jgi:tetratricopeptide (TPR) repeat protein
MHILEVIMADKIDPNPRFAEAMSEFVGENYGRSIDILGEVIEKDPTHKLALAARGSAHLKQNDPAAALADFNRAVEIDSGYARAYHLRGLARVGLGENEAALADFGKAIDLDPRYGAAYFSRATLLADMGKEDRAAEDMEMVAQLTHANIETFANENNIWRSHHLRVESAMESELNR